MNILGGMNMSQMLLLDKRTQSLIEDYVPQGEILEGVVCFFSVFADYTRVKILFALAISELCVTDLSRILDINQTTISHQLRFLKTARLVRSRREGKTVLYALADSHVTAILALSADHIRE
jgi:ArsR family transcriptional regulator